MQLASFPGLPTIHFLIANTYITSCKQSKASVGKSGNEGKMQTVLVWITFSTTKDLVTLQIFYVNAKYSSPKLCCQTIGHGLTFCYSQPVFLRQWLKIKKPDEDVSPRTSQGTTKQWLEKALDCWLYELNFYSKTFKLVTYTKLG